MIKRKIITLTLIITILFQSVFVTGIFATEAIGTNGSIPCGGKPGPGGISLVPSFRVGIISEKFNEPLDLSLENKKNIENDIIAHYYNHMPNMKHSIIFSPYNSNDYEKSVWLEPSKALVGWYQASSGDLKYIENKTDMPYKHRKLLKGKNNKISTGIFYEKLLEGIGDKKDLKPLKDGQWKQIGDTIENRVEKSSKVWNYILEHWDGTGTAIDFNIRNYTNFVEPEKTTITLAEKLANEAGHLDLLMTLYYLSPPNQQSIYYDEIERFIRFEGQEICPSLIAIDTVVRVSAPNYTKYPSQRIFLPSFDYVMYAAGVTPENSFYNPSAPAFEVLNSTNYKKDHTFKLISNLVQKSLDQMPNRKRTTDLRGDAYRNNGFSWGFGGVTGDKYLLTDRNYPDWRDSSVKNGIMESLIFYGDARGFVIGVSGVVFCKEVTPTGGFEIMTNPTEKVTIDRYKPTILGENVTVTIKGKISGDEESDWMKALDNIEAGSGFPKINIDLSVSGAVACQADTEANYSLDTSYPNKGNKNFEFIEKNELLKFLKGGSIEWNHNLADFKIETGTTYEFDYTANIQIKLSDDENDLITLQGIPDNKAKKIFIIPKFIPIEYRSFVSEPIAFSELKQGSIYHEDFEAMAGTPTTRDLYFAVGGSEFIVDIVTKYYIDQKATRNYRSWYSGTSCEFKAGDTAPNKPVGKQSANMHDGGNYSKTWTGSIPNDAKAVTVHGSGDVTAVCPAKPNLKEYEATLKEAEAFAEDINNTTVSHKSVSDKKIREFNSWGASVSPSKTLPETTDAKSSAWHTETSGTPPNQTTKKVADPTSATATPSGPGNFTITVTWSNPPHVICGPCCTHELPGIEDTWTQEITYDIQKIEQVNVWKIERGFADGMVKLLDTDEVTATVKQGDPNIFFNIAAEESSEAGRLRYSLEPTQHDNVVWNEGVRTNACNGMGDNGCGKSPAKGGHANNWADGILYTNNKNQNIENYHKSQSDAKDKITPEWNKFDERRNTENTATVISDFLILQTSSGDQSIIYFDKDSEPVVSQKNFEKVVNTVEEMWEDNPEAASHILPEEVNIGSYNGEFFNPRTKYKGNGDKHKTITALDNDPAKTISRPPRPSDLLIYQKNLDIPDAKKNGEYLTGNAKVLYDNILSHKGQSQVYTDTYDNDFNASGYVLPAPYSRSDSKINDIVIHNPVSAQYAVVLPSEASDQRTSESIVGGNLQKDIEEYVTKLKDNHPKQNFIVNGDAEKIANDGSLQNFKGEPSYSGDILFTRTIHPSYIISGKSSFQISVPGNSNKIAKYVTITSGIENTNYTFTGKISAHRCEGYFEIEALDYLGNILRKWTSDKHNNSSVITKTINFTTPNDTEKLKVSIVNGLSHNSVTNLKDCIFADDLSLTMEGGSTAEWIPLSYTISQETSINNPDYVPGHYVDNPKYRPPVIHDGERKIYTYNGSYSTYTVPIDGKYTLEVWGAEGGNGSGGKGGYSYGEITLSKDKQLYIYPGGSNGWNGGGSGHGRTSQVGGGGSDIRLNGNALNNRIIVAGGGGGRGDRDSGSNGGYGGYGGGSSGGSGGDRCGSRGYGGTQSSGGSGGSNGGHSGGLGYGGSNNSGSSSGGGGGGGGYYGGGAGGNDYSRYNDNDDSGGGGGSGYTDGVSNGSMKSGNQTMPKYSGGDQTGNSGHGVVVITEPDVYIPGNGEPEKIYIPPKGTPKITISSEISKTIAEPPDDWYETIIVKIPASEIKLPNDQIIHASKYLTLDYPFQVYFPNRGDFYGDGSHGLSRTTNQRGKGFKDYMNTTEWTKEKIAKFDYNVIYNNRLYPAGYEIPLVVDEDTYDFYLPLANKEAISAGARFYAIANNGNTVDNSYPTNKSRGPNRNAKHSAFKMYNIDIIGRIGNLVMEDTGDFRFSNIFKQSVIPTEWYIPNVVPKVSIDQQNSYLGPSIDIRGESVGPTTNYLNTYGCLDFLQKSPLSFPLSPSKNNIEALVRQPLRVGYPIFMDIQTIGNYYSLMKISPYYYGLDITTGKITPVDVYMNVDDKYQPINIFDNVKEDGNIAPVYDYPIALNWEEEAPRRNYHTQERNITEFVRDNTYNVDTEGNEIPLPIPLGKYHTFGNAQSMLLTGRNRTFIGSSNTYGMNRNPDDILREYDYNQQAQRWHFSFKLPSSAIFIPHGSKITNDNMDIIMNDRSVIIAAAKIIVGGDTYFLEYKHPNGNGSVTLAGRTHSLDSIPYNVYAVYSSEKSSSDDLDTSGTH